MLFSEIYGNKELKTNLLNMAVRKKTGHALLLQEDEGLGGLLFAIALAQYLNCTGNKEKDSCGECSSCRKYSKLIHPDLHFSFPVTGASSLTEQEKKKPVSDYFLNQWRSLVSENPYFGEQDFYEKIGIENKSGIISVNESKLIMDKLLLKSFEGEYKTMIIWLPEKMTAEASNKLLKLLEEPPAGTLFILVSQSPEKLLSTILSRCQIIRLLPMQTKELADILAEKHGLPLKDAQTTARLAAGSYGKAVKIIEEQEEEKEFDSYIKNLLEAGIKKSLSETIPIWESLADLGKEKQKEFCLYCENFIRKLYMIATGLESISFAKENETSYLCDLSKKIKPSFYPKGIEAFDDALRCIESNVNSKLVFCDLCNRLLLYL